MTFQHQFRDFSESAESLGNAVRVSKILNVDQLWIEPHWVHSDHQAAPVALEPSAGLAAVGQFLHRSVSQRKYRQRNSSAWERRRAHSMPSRCQWEQ